MNIRFLQMAGLMGWLTLTQAAMSQPPPPRGQLDHPSHRYLPPPVGKGSIVEQVRALEQLNATSGKDEPSQPLLSPSQLKQLDSIVESFRNDKGELELPDPQSIPKQWIDSLLPDPKQRQQVKDVLEEYARTRNLQLDNNPKSNGLPPLESPATGSKGTRTDKPRGSPASDGPRGTDNNLNRDKQSTGAPDEQPTTTDGVPKDKLAELRTLYETLQKIQEQRSQQQSNQSGSNSSQWNRSNVANDRNRNATSSSRNDPRSSGRPSRPNESIRPPRSTSGSNLRDRPNRPPATNQSKSANPNSAQPGRFRSAPPLTDDDATNGIGTNSLGSGDNSTVRTPDGGLRPKDGEANNEAPPQGTPPGSSADPKAPALTPFDEGYNFAADQQVPIDPFAQPEDATADPNPQNGRGSRPSAPRSRPAEPFKVTQLAQEPREQPRSRNANAGEPELDLKKSIEQSGLGTVLKRIVQKTLKEQGFDPNQPGNPMPGWSNTTPSNSPLPTPGLPGGKTPGAVTTEQLKNWANSVANAPNNPSNNSSSAANSAWGNWVREVWQALAEAPARGSSASSQSSSPAAASPTVSFGQLPDVRWTNSMTLAVIFVVGVIGLLVWLSRRRMAELADTSAAQAEWVRTVMAQGLKTRGDVVRAFHQLVKQSRAVSDWWTHRSIVKHFDKQTPQLASAINELAIVYEQARYYPEDVELSQQQLAKVRTLLESVKIPNANRA